MKRFDLCTLYSKIGMFRPDTCPQLQIGELPSLQGSARRWSGRDFLRDGTNTNRFICICHSRTCSVDSVPTHADTIGRHVLYQVSKTVAIVRPIVWDCRRTQKRKNNGGKGALLTLQCFARPGSIQTERRRRICSCKRCTPKPFINTWRSTSCALRSTASRRQKSVRGEGGILICFLPSSFVSWSISSDTRNVHTLTLPSEEPFRLVSKQNHPTALPARARQCSSHGRLGNAVETMWSFFR